VAWSGVVVDLVGARINGELLGQSKR
jgi:hypothetical protein